MSEDTSKGVYLSEYRIKKLAEENGIIVKTEDGYLSEERLKKLEEEHGIRIGFPQTNGKCVDCDHWKHASERPHRPFDGCEKYAEEDPNSVCSCFVKSQKSMDDDNPTIPVNRGVAGVYMPEPNEKTRARVGLVQAAERYIATTNCDFDVFDISSNNGNVYQLRITKVR